MKGDFSRLTFDPAKGYTSVRQQQGRLLLDADWNEQADILLHQLETFAGDLIGPSGAPAQELLTFTYQKSSTVGADIPGTGTVHALGKSVSGSKTHFIAQVKPDTNQITKITIGGQMRTVTRVISDVRLEVDEVFSPDLPKPQSFTYQKDDIGVSDTPGTGTVRTAGRAVVGSGTEFLSQVKPNTNQEAQITIGGQVRTVASIVTATFLLVDEAFSPDLPRPVNFQVSASGGDLAVAAGHYYVGGVLCELEADVSLTAQPDLPGYTLPAEDGRYLAYLEARELHETTVDWPDLREPALGGPDTASRTRVVAQIRLAPVSADATCGADLALPGSAPSFELAAELAANSTSPLANRLYRVEIHTGGPLGTATFKWARDNATALAPIEALGPGEVTVASPVGLDGENAFAAGDWVEVTDRQRTLAGEPGVLVRLSRVQGQVLTVEAWPGGIAPTLSDGAVLRRWDSEGDVVVTATDPLPLEDGIEVRFAADAGAQALPGDAWLIPARTAIGTAGGGVLWLPPTGSPAAPTFLPPQGRPRLYAPLAIVDRLDGAWTVKTDCRGQFGRLSELENPNDKVDVAGDTMTGPLFIDGDLWVTGKMQAGTGADQTEALNLKQGDLQLTTGNDASSGILFPGASQAFVRFFQPTGSGPRLTLGAPGPDDSLWLNDRLVIASGQVGIGGSPDGPQLDVKGQVRAHDLRIEGGVTIAGSTTPQAGDLLTSDASGKASWKPAVVGNGKPVFFSSPVFILSGNGPHGETRYPKSGDTSPFPQGATAVILEAQAATTAGDGRILISLAPGASQRLLLRVQAQAMASTLYGYSGDWSSQGVFPLANLSFYYAVVADSSGAFNRGWILRALGYYGTS